jgi:hypothetical protein
MTTSESEVDLAQITEAFITALRERQAQRQAESGVDELDPATLAVATAVAEEAIQALVSAKTIDEALAARMGTAFAEVLEVYPDAATLTPEELEEMFQELAA